MQKLFPIFAESRGSMNNKLEKSKKLIQNVFLFFLASFIPKTISFFMVPLYTECLSTLEYGTIDLITTTVQLLLPILTLQVHTRIMFVCSLREVNLRFNDVIQ